MSPREREPVAVWPGVLDSVPQGFASFLAEPAFSVHDCTFCIWREPIDEHWQHGPIAFPETGADDPDGSEGLLCMFDGKPETYVDFAADYYEKTLDIDFVRRIYAHGTLTPLIVAELNPHANWESTAKDAEEILYPFG